ncbi:hypothetical protein BCV72DRAFT_139918 [Rhizopus microsporus var. microsporus]|uniref:Uncharacterized protein n=1 Tax=Rhizopus microsporus var. microsporus TaxID=86635 RepID=A0A1X0R080_RHIZD|nr:hypothetical protein BCV72DRAFT_139918 [Rhizopus microsporus var. microsporus]
MVKKLLFIGIWMILSLAYVVHADRPVAIHHCGEVDNCSGCVKNCRHLCKDFIEECRLAIAACLLNCEFFCGDSLRLQSNE